MTRMDMSHHQVNTITFWQKAIVLHLILYPEQNEKAGCYAYRQSCNVDKGVGRLLAHIAKGDAEVVVKHNE